MKRSIIIPTLLAAGLFGGGIIAGEVIGIPGTSAASAIATPNTTQTVPDRGPWHGGFHDGPHADGTVTAINGDTLTISADNDPAGSDEYTEVTTVDLTDTTQYDAGHDSTGTVGKSSVKVGSYVIVNGTVSSDGKTITADSVNVLPGGPMAGH